MVKTAAKPGFFVQDRYLYSKDNEKVILRGVNHMFIWTDREGKTIPEIAKTGANCVRIVWNTRGRIRDLDNIIKIILDCLKGRVFGDDSNVVDLRIRKGAVEPGGMVKVQVRPAA